MYISITVRHLQGFSLVQSKTSSLELQQPPLELTHMHRHNRLVMLNMLNDANSTGAVGPSGHFMLINAAPPSAESLD